MREFRTGYCSPPLLSGSIRLYTRLIDHPVLSEAFQYIIHVMAQAHLEQAMPYLALEVFDELRLVESVSDSD